MQDISTLSRLSTSNIADAHDHLGLVCKWLSRDLHPTKRGKFWGAADVVSWGPTRKSADIRSASPSTWDEVKLFIGHLAPGPDPRVYVAGCKDLSIEYVLLGGMSLTYLDISGYRGAVVNGIIRDYDEVQALDLPVWSAGFGVMDSQGCMKVESRGTSCCLNGHVVYQNDIIIGDGNGVVSISARDVVEVTIKAAEIAGIEDQTLARVRGGESLFDMVEAGGHI